MSLKLLFLNLHGMTESKLLALEALLSGSVTDIIVVAETWFLEEKKMRESEYFVEHSLEFRERNHGRKPGGVLLLAAKHLHRKIRAAPELDAVLFTIGGLHIAGVYLPPLSLPDDEVGERLDRFGDPSIVVGDINAKKGVDNPRSRHIARWAIGKDLHWLSPDQEPPTNWDHVLGGAGTVLRYSLIEMDALAVESDHRKALSITLATNLGAKQRRRGPPKRHYAGHRRYDYRRLLHPDLSLRREEEEIVRVGYASQAPWVTGALEFWEEKVLDLQQSASGGDLEALTDLADVIDEYLVHALQKVADKLYTYEKRSGPVPSLHTSDPVQRYKRLNKALDARKSPTIVSPEAGTSVLTGAETRFNALWGVTPTLSPPAPRRQPRRYVPPPNEWVNDLTTRAVRKEIRNYKWDKASGTDGISIVLLKALCSGPLAHHMALAFRLYLRLTCTPRRWNQSLTVLLPKDTDAATCSVMRTRPIAVAPLFRLIFEKLTLPMLQKHPRLKLLPAQTGFQEGKSTAINVALLHADLQDKDVRVVFIDLADCYDRLSYEYQMTVWMARKIEPYLINLMVGLVQRGMSTIVSVAGQLTGMIEKKRGVPQGSVWSPFLYNLAVDQLARNLQRAARDRANASLGMVPRPVGLFADDMTLQATEDEGLDLLVSTVSSWCASSGMKIAWNKCAALGTDRPIVGPMGEEIAVKESTTYLGVPFHVTERGRGVDWAAYYNEVTPRAQRQLRHMMALASTWHPGHRLALVRTYLRPVCEYMAGLFFWTCVKELGLSAKQLAARISRGTLGKLLLDKSRFAPQWKALEEVWSTWLQFVVGSKRAGPGVASMTALERPTVRFMELGVLQWNLLAQQKHCPWLPGALRKLGIAHWAKSKPGPPTEWKRKLHTARRDRLLNAMGDCAGRIESEARTKTGMDRVFTVKDKTLCTSLIRWRQGTWGYKRYTLCVCGAAFNLSHFKGCSQVSPPPSAFGLERHLKADVIPEARLKEVLASWEQQLAETPDQRADESQFRPSQKQKRASKRQGGKSKRKTRKICTRSATRAVTRSLDETHVGEEEEEELEERHNNITLAGPQPPSALSQESLMDEFDTASEAYSDIYPRNDVQLGPDTQDFG